MTLKHFTVERITLLLAWAAFVAYVTAPKGEALGLPAGLHIGDFFALPVALGFFIILTRKNGIFPVPAHNYLVSFFLIYVLAVLVLPLLGMLFYHAPFSLYLGDLRWIAILFVGLALILIYHVRGAECFFPHFTSFLLVLTFIQLLMFGSQISMSVFGGSANILLDLWYPDGEFGYGKYGHHIHRYAAGLYTAAGLALYGGITLIFSVFSLYLSLEKSRALDFKLFFMFITGALFVVASGNRAMLFGAPSAVIFILFLVVLVRSKITYRSIAAGVCAIFLIIGVSVLAFHHNIGRIASSDRLISTIHWLTGTSPMPTDRASEIWPQIFQEAFSEFGWAGTLVNASHALGTMDSYFVLAIAQGGPFIIVPFILLCAGLMGTGLCQVIKGDYMSTIALGVVIPILLASVAQNTMTGLDSRVFLTLAVCGLYIWKRTPSGFRRLPFKFVFNKTVNRTNMQHENT